MKQPGELEIKKFLSWGTHAFYHEGHFTLKEPFFQQKSIVHQNMELLYLWLFLLYSYVLCVGLYWYFPFWQMALNCLQKVMEQN